VIDDITYLLEHNWIVRFRAGDTPYSPLVIALHGWTGNEHSMSIFQSYIPDDYSILSPRGPVKAHPFGYGWVPRNDSPSDWEQCSTQIVAELDGWLKFFHLSPKSIALIGFSQGAALAYTLCLSNSQRFNRVAALAGMLPSYLVERITRQNASSLSLYIAHGSLDEVIPVEQAQKAARLFQAAGAAVNYCESVSGHKLGSACLSGLAGHFSTPLQQTD
jgi:phospholipase/carboxylesterase